MLSLLILIAPVTIPLAIYGVWMVTQEERETKNKLIEALEKKNQHDSWEREAYEELMADFKRKGYAQE